MTETQHDTLCILLPKSDPLEGLPSAYDLGFFQDNTFIHPEVVGRPNGVVATPLPYRLWRDDWVTVTVLLCFFILTFVLRLNRYRLLAQLRNFLYSPRQQHEPRAVQTSLEEQSTLILTILLCLIGGVGYFEYTQNRLGIFLGQLSPYLLMAIYMGCWGAYFLTKNITYIFVNWIFFDKESRLLWKDNVTCLISVESVLLFIIVVASVYFELSLENVFIPVSAVVIAIKSMSLYKTQQIFFREKYGSLHLFVYFCTLEIAPLLVITRILMLITDSLIVKY
jgi:hypothetical protein